MPKYSIIIPSYNAAKTIGQTFESIANQTCRDFEVILIDGGSQDGTLEVAAKYSSFIRYQVSERDEGIYDAMNKGVKQAKGDFIIFLGADDVFYNDYVLSDVLPFLKDNKVYYGQAYFLNKNITYDGRFHSYKFALRNICHQAIFYPADILKRVQFELKYPLLSDYHLNLLLLKQKVKFEYIGVVIAKFNDGGASAVATDAPFERDKLTLVKENLGLLPYLYANFRRFLFPVQRTVLGWLRGNLQRQQ
jgi:glycosyltransferase involved in cell wall biosynthesis